MAQVTERDDEEIRLCDAGLARDCRAEDGDGAEEKKDVGDRVGKDESAVGDGG